MKFIVEISEEDFGRLREYQEQAQGVFNATQVAVIQQMFYLADMGSGWLEDLTDNIKVVQVETK